MELFSHDNENRTHDNKTPAHNRETRKTEGTRAPLAYRMSPRSLDEYIGQDHIIGEGRLLRRVVQADRLSSLIFYGPPGTGKTSLARVIANTTQSAFTSLNAVLTGVKDLREKIDEAKERFDLYEKRTILFVDEVHRWNKAQQDALLPWVENGTVILIGATTHNPYFEVNAALVSRSRIFQLTPLTRDELFAVARGALTDAARGYGTYRVKFEEGALEHLVDVASGDARSLLNALELAIETTPERFPPPEGSTIHVSFEAAEESIQRKAVLYDKEGDYHFDVISAFIKSLRGSDPDAALYWLAKMVHAGEDPRFIFRRMLIAASEDVGMADPHALTVVESSAAAFDRVGMPEGRYHLAHATLYLANAPKSNSTLGFFDALSAVEEAGDDEVPRHLKDANRDKKGFGHGEGYLYPHAYREHWVAQHYLPTGLQGRVFYRPSEIGYEASIRSNVQRRREAHLAAMLEDERPEVLTYSPPDKERDKWLARTADNRSEGLLELRDAVFESLEPARHHRILVFAAADGLFLWEALRQAPEGGVTGVLKNEKQKRYLMQYAEAMDMLDRPELVAQPIEREEASLGEVESSLKNEGAPFESENAPFEREGAPLPKGKCERVVAHNFTLRRRDKAAGFRLIHSSLSEGGRAVLAEAVPKRGPRLSQLPRLSRAGGLDDSLRKLLERAEELLYEESGHPLLEWDCEDLEAAAREAGFETVRSWYRRVPEKRTLHEGQIAKWLHLSGRTDSTREPNAAKRSGVIRSIRSLGDAVEIAAEEMKKQGDMEVQGDTDARGKAVSRLQENLIDLLEGAGVEWYTEYCILRLDK